MGGLEVYLNVNEAQFSAWLKFLCYSDPFKKKSAGKAVHPVWDCSLIQNSLNHHHNHLQLMIPLSHFTFCLSPGPDGSLRVCHALHCDSVTGLIRPNAHSHMLLHSGHTMPVPPDFFLHPQTGRVMPIFGNVAYDPATSTLVLTTDSCAGKMRATCCWVVEKQVKYTWCNFTFRNLKQLNRNLMVVIVIPSVICPNSRLWCQPHEWVL